jgi:hypothetical protein
MLPEDLFDVYHLISLTCAPNVGLHGFGKTELC